MPTSTSPSASPPPARPEGLLPADPSTPEVAEEVSLDQQSDSVRRVGAAPPHVPGAAPADAMAETLQPSPPDLAQAVERAVPPAP
jgi:hypothetical protein